MHHEVLTYCRHSLILEPTPLNQKVIQIFSTNLIIKRIKLIMKPERLTNF